jgi:hypothetical protein
MVPFDAWLPLMILYAGRRVASRRSGGARLRGAPGAALDATGGDLGELCPWGVVW